MYLYTWGNGFQSKLGHGDSENLCEPLFLETNYNFIDICAGNNHSAGIDEDNNLIVWGPHKYFGLQFLIDNSEGYSKDSEGRDEFIKPT